MVAVVSPTISLILEDLALTSFHEGLIGLAAPAVYAFMGVLAPTLGRRYGLEAMMLVCLGVSAFGEIGRSLAQTPIGFVVWTIPALAGAGIGNVLIPPLIKKYFPDRVPIVTSIYTVFIIVSTAIPPLFILSLARSTGWRFSVGIWAGFGIMGLIPWVFVLLSMQGTGQRLTAIKRRLNPRTYVEKPPRLDTPLWKSKVAWSITVIFAVNSLIAYTMFAWLPHVLTGAGISVSDAAMYLAVFALGSLPGAFLTPILTARLKHVEILPIIFSVAYAISLTALAIDPTFLTIVWILLSRIGDCFFPYSITMINMRTTTTRGSIAMSGFAQSLGYTLAIVGPYGFGVLHTVSGNWHVPMFAVVAVLPLQFIGGWVLAKSKPAEV